MALLLSNASAAQAVRPMIHAATIGDARRAMKPGDPFARRRPENGPNPAPNWRLSARQGAL